MLNEYSSDKVNSLQSRSLRDDEVFFGRSLRLTKQTSETSSVL